MLQKQANRAFNAFRKEVDYNNLKNKVKEAAGRRKEMKEKMKLDKYAVYEKGRVYEVWFFPLLKICMYMTVSEEIKTGTDAG